MFIVVTYKYKLLGKVVQYHIPKEVREQIKK